MKIKTKKLIAAYVATAAFAPACLFMYGRGIEKPETAVKPVWRDGGVSAKKIRKWKLR